MSDERDFMVAEWRAVPSRNVLVRGCDEIRLEPGSMNLLVYLARVPGEVVSTSELINELWGGRIVDENQVYKRIAQLREAFGGGQAGKAVIQTIPKRGYRLIAPVGQVPDILGPTSQEHAADGRFTLSMPHYLAISLLPIAVVLVAWITGAVNFSSDRHATIPETPGIVRLAVLPFEFVSLDPTNAFLATGLHREIIGQLTRLDRVGVIAATTMDQYADSPLTLEQIGRELNADAILEGTVSYDGRRLRLVLSMIDVETSESVWGDTYQYELTDVLDVQLNIADQVASRLEVEFPGGERARLASIPPVNSEAYETYLRGVASTGNLSPLSYGLSDDLHFFLARASNLDSDFSLPYSRRALDYAQSLLRPIRRADGGELGRDVRERLTVQLANQALAIDRGDPLAHVALGWVAYLEGDVEQGKARFDAALELGPYDRDVLIDYAWLSARVQPQPESLQLAQRVFLVAPELAPNFIGYAHWTLGDLDAAAAALDDSQASGAPAAYRNLLRAEIAVARGDYQTALVNLEADQRQIGNNMPLPSHVALRCYLYGRAGATDDAQRQFELLEGLAADYEVGSLNLALANLGIKKEEMALSLMLQAADEGISDHGWLRRSEIIANMYRDPVLDRPEFVEVRSRL